MILLDLDLYFLALLIEYFFDTKISYFLARLASGQSSDRRRPVVAAVVVGLDERDEPDLAGLLGRGTGGLRLEAGHDQEAEKGGNEGSAHGEPLRIGGSLLLFG